MTHSRRLTILVKMGSNGSILCVMSMVVMLDLVLARLSMMIFSLSGSMPDVPSSNRSSRGFFIKARARMILCFYPPDKLEPFSAISASRPPLDETNSLALVSFKHSTNLSSEQSKCWFPYLRLSLKLPLKR